MKKIWLTLIMETEGNRYRRRKESKITLRMSDKVVWDHTINYIPKMSLIHINLCINIHIHLERKFPIWADNAVPQDPLIICKIPNIRNEEPLIELVVRTVKKTPKTYMLLQLPWVTSWR